MEVFSKVLILVHFEYNCDLRPAPNFTILIINYKIMQ